MSYTPKDEKFITYDGEKDNDRIQNLIDSMDSVSEVCLNRIRCSTYGDNWTKEHKKECHILRTKLQELEVWMRDNGFCD